MVILARTIDGPSFFLGKSEIKVDSLGKQTVKIFEPEKITVALGRRQVVRHLVLVQAFGGSNPSAPVYLITLAVEAKVSTLPGECWRHD